MAKKESNSRAAVLAAIESGDGKRLDELAASGAEVGAKEIESATSMLRAAYDGLAGCLRVLLEAGADIEAKHMGRTAVMLASGNGRDACLKALVDAWADLDAQRWADRVDAGCGVWARLVLAKTSGGWGLRERKRSKREALVSLGRGRPDEFRRF